MQSKRTIWNFLDSLKGDKVVWMIVIMLYMCFIVCIFSSTSLEKEVLRGEKTRMDMVISSMKAIIMGGGALLFCYNFFRVSWWKKISQLGFFASAVLLFIVVTHIKCPPLFEAAPINGEWRVIKIRSFQFHIYEAVKVAMVMYLSWAVNEYKNGRFALADYLSNKRRFKWLKKKWWQKFIYIYLPIFIVAVMILPGSGSSSVFIAGIMIATALVGGLDIKEVIPPMLILVLLGIFMIGMNKVSGGEIFSFLRTDTWASRLEGMDKDIETFKSSPKNSYQWQKSLDHIRQPYSAKIAIKEGGLIGKGPGQSTQKYIVPVYYEDYMYTFIVEEYGLFGALVVLVLYLSLLARGSVIARNCKGYFEKIAVAGLVLLISGQGLLHMLVNSRILPMTGQTLPLISRGTTSFVMFSIAFGILLSISSEASVRIEKETRAADPITLQRDGLEGDLDDLDDLDGFESEMTE